MSVAFLQLFSFVQTTQYVSFNSRFSPSVRRKQLRARFFPFFVLAFSFFFSIFCFRANGANNMYARCRLKYISRGVFVELTYQHYHGNISCSFGYFTFPKTLRQQTSRRIKINSIIQWAALCIIACA